MTLAMTTLRPDLLRPRRIAAACAVFLLLGGLGAGAIGAVQAASGAETDGILFRLAPPRAGDQGLYILAAAEGRTLAEAQASTSTRQLSFLWLPDERVHDANATEQWANMVLVNETRTDRPHGEQDLVALRPGSDSVVTAFAVDRPLDGAPGANGANKGTGAAITTQRHHLQQVFGTGLARALPCGFAAPLRNPQAEGDGLPLASGCRYVSAVSRTLVLDRVWTASGSAFALAHEEDEAGPRLRYWFRSDVPYPVRVDAVGAAWSLRLVSFARGLEDVRDTPEPLQASAPPELRMAPRTETGPDAAGMVHPFPLSAAFERAKADSREVRDFLAAHPAAYMAQASYREMVSRGEGETWRTWHFTVSDGRSALDVSVRELERERVAQAPGLLPATFSYDHWASDPEGAVDEYPLPEQVPATMPTVPSLQDSWRAYASERYREEQPNAWGFRLRCATTCATMWQTYEAGFTHYNRTVQSQDPLGLMPLDPIDSEVSSLVEYEGLGADDLLRPSAYSEDRLDWVREGQETAPAPATFPAPPARAHALGFFPSAPAAAAIGLGALLAAVAYWLWPVLKAGPAALFSRVRGAALLEHPLRASIHQMIEAEPGIHHRALARALGRSKGSVEHHLRKLTEAGLVTAVAARGHTCYFAGRPPAQAAAGAPVLKSPVARAIVDAVRSRPGIRPVDLARDLAVAPTTVHYHLHRLRQANLLTASETGSALHLHAA